MIHFEIVLFHLFIIIINILVYIAILQLSKSKHLKLAVNVVFLSINIFYVAIALDDIFLNGRYLGDLWEFLCYKISPNPYLLITTIFSLLALFYRPTAKGN
ncbi:MAG TPA: hypothetical protein DDW90_11360 [Cyanobacteria bacterium UBA9971]|nr:hypothetical protein [Cyanobacteria bacterium UBA9971]